MLDRAHRTELRTATRSPFRKPPASSIFLSRVSRHSCFGTRRLPTRLSLRLADKFHSNDHDMR
eukprot:6477254-Amphidinium_carterae.1